MKSNALENVGAAKSSAISVDNQCDIEKCGIISPLDAQEKFCDPPEPLTPLEVAQFWSRVKVGLPFECWPWQGRRGDKGYGRYKRTMAHRVASTLVNGPVAAGDLVRHSCDNPPCCNPKHLLSGTQQENMDDAVARNRTARGAANGRTKLTADQVAFIRDNPDNLTGPRLAARFGVCEATISYVRNRRSWKYA